MSELWDPAAPGVLALPSGRLVRGRGLARAMPDGPEPEYGVYLLGSAPEQTRWPMRWVRWPDFRLPKDDADARDALTQVWRRSAAERVEVACHGGRGRTGTALACIAVLDGVAADEAVAFVRAHYDRHAVETRGQRRWVQQFPAS